MSFEGYYQRLCKRGHMMSADVYLASDNDRCMRCDEPIAWQHLVDQTNDEGEIVQLELDFKNECEHCGSILEMRYKIPQKKGSPNGV